LVNISLLGIPRDENSSFMKGASEAPPLIRHELFSDCYSSWSETGIDICAAGRLIDHGDIQFDPVADPWDLIEQKVGQVMDSGDPLICLGGDHAITHPIMRAVRRHHPFKRFGVEIVEAGRCGEAFQLDLKTPVYVSMDIDALDPAYAPGVSHREPGGLSTRQVIDLIHTIDQPIVAADVVEYNPRCDISNMTATVAAKLVKEIGGMMVKLRGP
jgi:arginase